MSQNQPELAGPRGNMSDLPSQPPKHLDSIEPRGNMGDLSSQPPKYLDSIASGGSSGSRSGRNEAPPAADKLSAEPAPPQPQPPLKQQ